MPSQQLRNHKMRYVLVRPVRHVTSNTSQKRNVKSLYCLNVNTHDT